MCRQSLEPAMSCLSRRRLSFAAAVALAVATADCHGIEMFTYYGDGSRIGLPSLEVPIEAYPGIPLRSDRLRARRRAMRMGPAGAVRIGPPGYSRGVTIRAMPPVAPTAPTDNPALSVAPIPPDPDFPAANPAVPAAKSATTKIRGGAEKIPTPAPER